MRNLALHWKILIGMALGILFPVIFLQIPYFSEEIMMGDKKVGRLALFISDWIKPFGTIFINALKLIAVPLIIVSLIKGIAEIEDISKLSKMGGRTVALYVASTLLAVSVGLLIVNLVKPGSTITEETRKEILAEFEGDAQKKIAMAEGQKGEGPLQALVDLVPGNIFSALTSNKNMLQVIFFVIFFSICLLKIPSDKAQPVKKFFDGLNEIILKMIDFIMLCAPYGVFALMAALIVSAPSMELITALLWYSLAVVSGLALLIFLVYPLVIRSYTGRSYASFFKGISPAQLLAFSTSSSAATLPAVSYTHLTLPTILLV